MGQHARLSASGAHRWMKCPGSVRASEGMPDESSDYAKEGTAAHELAAECLEQNLDPMDAYGKVYEVEGKKFRVNDDMAEAVQVYVDEVRDYAKLGGGGELFVEQQLDELQTLHPDFGGTADSIILTQKLKRLTVPDYKHGAGLPVEVADNPQLMKYALGALIKFAKYDIEWVEIVVVQPRAGHPDGPVRSWTISVKELRKWGKKLVKAAKATEDPDAPRVAGSHCRFCPAAGVCPANYEKTLEVARAEFGDNSGELTVKEPQTLSPEEIADVLANADIIDNWLKNVRAYAHHEADAGREIPGFKLVPKRATRKWHDDDEAEASMMVDFDFDPDDMVETKLKSPAQMEKLLPKARRDELAEYYSNESSGTNLVPEDAPGEPVKPSAESDFTPV